MSCAGAGEPDDRPRARSQRAHGRPFTFEVEASTKAPAEVVWSLVGTAARWREWSWMTRTFLLKEGEPEPDGVGALRRFAVGPFGSVEEVLEWDPPLHLAYATRKGLPVRTYRADVRIERVGEGAHVRWSGTLVPLVPGTGRLVSAFTRALVAGFAKRVCLHADRLVAGGST